MSHFIFHFWTFQGWYTFLGFFQKSIFKGFFNERAEAQPGRPAGFTGRAQPAPSPTAQRLIFEHQEPARPARSFFEKAWPGPGRKFPARAQPYVRSLGSPFPFCWPIRKELLLVHAKYPSFLSLRSNALLITSDSKKRYSLKNDKNHKNRLLCCWA